VKKAHAIARVSLDFFLKIELQLSLSNWLVSDAGDHPTYYSHSHVAADKLTGRLISGCQDQTRKLAGLHHLGAPLALIVILKILEARFNCSTTVFAQWFITIISKRQQYHSFYGDGQIQKSFRCRGMRRCEIRKGVRRFFSGTSL
jgi:hypothetical protein